MTAAENGHELLIIWMHRTKSYTLLLTLIAMRAQYPLEEPMQTDKLIIYHENEPMNYFLMGTRRWTSSMYRDTFYNTTKISGKIMRQTTTECRPLNKFIRKLKQRNRHKITRINFILYEKIVLFDPDPNKRKTN